MIRFFQGIKRAADFFSVNPNGISFKDEQRVKAVESTVKFFSKEFIESSGNRYDLKFIKLEEAIFELKKNIHYLDSELHRLKSPNQLTLPAEQAKTVRKPKALKLQNVEEEVKKVKSLLTQAQVKRLFEYRDGELYWKVDRIRAKKGDKAGTTRGYKIVFIEGQHYTFGHVIFLMFHGYVPERVSFVDGNYRNTRIENLRAATMSQVSGSAKKSKANTCGYKGITFLKKRNKYVAQINKLGKHYHLGHFDTPKEAYKAYCKAAKKLHGEFARVA